MDALKGREQSLSIRRQLEKDLAGANALFAARGALQGQGSAAAAIDAAKRRASEDINAAMFGANANADASRMQARQYKSQASSQVIGGFMGAADAIGKNSRIVSLLDG
jgi:hypothetical protein